MVKFCKEAVKTARLQWWWGGDVEIEKRVPYDILVNGDRRMAERRQHDLDRRGVLRWDPIMRERRFGKDRRRTGAVRRER
ncbi:MAG TPA: hypothetical protein VIR61_03450 [Sulfuricaulis sp.]